MSETWKSANERMACVDCGESGAQPYTTVYGRHVRVCSRCLHRWESFGLRSREPMYEEPRAPQIGGTP